MDLPVQSSYVWNRKLLQEASDALQPCNIVFSEGLWTHHMLRVDESSLGSTTTHVAVLMDDVNVTNIDTASFLATMIQAKYDVASAAIPGWHYDALQPRSECKSHRTDYSDVLFTVFTRQAWSCWKRQINAEQNEHGWGYDVLLAEKCGVNVGIIDSAIALHKGKCKQGGDCTRTYNKATASTQLWDWNIHQTGARNEEEARAHWQHVVKERPNRFPCCDEYRANVFYSSARRESNALFRSS